MSGEYPYPYPGNSDPGGTYPDPPASYPRGPTPSQVKRVWLLTCLALVLAAATIVPDHAFAQATSGALSGGSSGLLGTTITWFTTNLLGGLIMVGVICIGGMFMFMRLYIAGVAMMVCGALIADNYQAIAALL
jgi:hypothetical protein